MILTRPARWQDIESILERLSEQHQVEYRKIGYPGPDFTTRLWHFFLRGETACIWHDGKPQCFISIAHDNGVPVTWVGVTRECFDKGIGPLRAGRDYMREAVKRHGPIVSLLSSQHPKVTQWMKLLGAELKADDGALKLFVFEKAA